MCFIYSYICEAFKHIYTYMYSIYIKICKVCVYVCMHVRHIFWSLIYLAKVPCVLPRWTLPAFPGGLSAYTQAASLQ